MDRVECHGTVAAAYGVSCGRFDETHEEELKIENSCIGFDDLDDRVVAVVIDNATDVPLGSGVANRWCLN